MHLDFPVIANMETAVPHSPGQVDAFMGVPERLRPAARVLEGIAPDGDRALPDVHRGTAPSWVADAYAWSPAPGSFSSVRIDDPGLDHAERWIGGELHRHSSQDVVLRKAGIIVEEEQQLPLDQAHSSVTTGWDAEVLTQPMGLDPFRQANRLPPVADHHNVEVDLALVQQTGKTALQIVGPVAHRQNNDPELRPRRPAHRSLDDASTAIR